MARALDEKRRVRLPLGAEDEIVALYCSGSSSDQLRRKFGTTIGAIYRALRNKGVPSRRRYVSLSVDAENEVVELYNSGWSASRIGCKFGTTYTPVYRVLKKHGVERRRTGEGTRKITGGVKQSALEAFERGASGSEAATIAGISAGAMSNLLKQEGIPSRRKVRVFTETEELEIVKRYAAGEWSNAIAADFGVFHKRILAVCDAHDVPRNRPPRPSWTDRLGRGHTFRSSWELVTAKYLDAEGYEWDYEVQRYPILVDGKSRTYMPDFWITAAGALTLVDVKGRWRCEQRRRVELFREQYPICILRSGTPVFFKV